MIFLVTSIFQFNFYNASSEGHEKVVFVLSSEFPLSTPLELLLRQGDASRLVPCLWSIGGMGNHLFSAESLSPAPRTGLGKVHTTTCHWNQTSAGRRGLKMG
jgi:hypothetical protein